jgi:hypothetical protein
VIVQSLQQYGITLSLDICTRYNIRLSITCTSQLVLLVPISGNRRIEQKTWLDPEDLESVSKRQKHD